MRCARGKLHGTVGQMHLRRLACALLFPSAFGCHDNVAGVAVATPIAPPAVVAAPSASAPPAVVPERICALHPVYSRVGQWSPDGRFLIAACAEGDPEQCDTHLDVWPFAGADVPRALDAGMARVSVSFSPDGTRMVTLADPTTGAGVLRLWDTSTWGRVLEHPLMNVAAAVFSADSSRLIVAGYMGQLDLFDPKLGRVVLARPLAHGREDASFEVGVDYMGNRRIVLTELRDAAVLDGETLKPLLTLVGRTNPRTDSEAQATHALARGSKIVLTKGQSTIELWDGNPLSRRASLQVAMPHAYRVWRALSLSPSARYLALVDEDGNLYVVDLVSRSVASSPRAEPSSVSSLRWISDDLLAFGRQENDKETVELWARDGKAPRWSAPGFAFDVSGDRMAVLTAKDINIVSLADLHALAHFPTLGSSGDRLSFRPGGDMIAHGGNVVRVVRIRDGKSVRLHRYAIATPLNESDVRTALVSDDGFDGDLEAAGCAVPRGPLSRVSGLAARFAAP